MIDFIFMLTRDDRTIEDCLETFEAVRPLGISHIGFKDMGVELDRLRELNRRIKASGALSYMEVVSISEEDCLASARAAAELGVDRLLGGTHAEAILPLLQKSGIDFYPFAGKPVGHPTRLEGAAPEIAADCRRFQALGCAGVDLLAFRAVDADPLSLIRAARAATGSYLIVAGSIDSPERIHEVEAAGANAFTIGSAVFNGRFAPTKGLAQSQLSEILAACG